MEGTPHRSADGQVLEPFPGPPRGGFWGRERPEPSRVVFAVGSGGSRPLPPTGPLRRSTLRVPAKRAAGPPRCQPARQPSPPSARSATSVARGRPCARTWFCVRERERGFWRAAREPRRRRSYRWCAAAARCRRRARKKEIAGRPCTTDRTLSSTCPAHADRRGVYPQRPARPAHRRGPARCASGGPRSARGVPPHIPPVATVAAIPRRIGFPYTPPRKDLGRPS